jgi:hypothetical protein
MRSEQLPADLAEMPLSPYRPVYPVSGLGRRLRAVVGIREEVLDWVPEERARYTMIGLIVLNTGLLSGIAMLVALSTVAGLPWPGLVVAGVVWAYLVVSLDTWMVVSMHGAHRARVSVYLPRLLMSLLIGVTIAEPLVVLVFRPTIHEAIAQSRQDELIAFGSTLRLCNPADGPAPGTPECAGRTLTVPGSPEPLRVEQANLIAQRDRLKPELDAANARLAELVDLEQAECAGVAAPGTTGVRGEGPECLRNKQAVERHRRDNRIDERQRELDGIDRRITDLGEQVRRADQTYGDRLEGAIRSEVDAKQRSHQVISVLDEVEALWVLADGSTAVWAAEWGLRLLLILFDCAPVLGKWLTGVSTYDRLVARQVETTKRLHDKHVDLFERRDAAVVEARVERLERERLARVAREEEARRQAQYQRERELDDEVERLAAQFRGEVGVAGSAA